MIPCNLVCCCQWSFLLQIWDFGLTLYNLFEFFCWQIYIRMNLDEFGGGLGALESHPLLQARH